MTWTPPGTDTTPWDQCAHAGVVFTIDSRPFVGGSDAEEITVSAAALFLLRTLTHDHTAANSVAESSQLFPHCGFTAHPVEGRFPVVVYGCNVGIDLDIRHSADTVSVRAEDGTEATVTAVEWRDAVVGFVDAVRAFYDASPPRQPFGDEFEDEGWRVFWNEWTERRTAAVRRA
jgi:hypothetical protein